MDQALVKEFATVLGAIGGSRCWGVAAGPTTGSVLNLHMGRQIPRQQPIPNPHLPEALRLYDGEFGLLVECAWRIETDDRIACSWLESEEDVGIRDTAISLMTDQAVLSVNAQLPFMDLVVRFSNAHTLKLFCDQTEPDSDNYVIFTTRYSYIVTAGGILLREAKHQRV